MECEYALDSVAAAIGGEASNHEQWRMLYTNVDMKLLPTSFLTAVASATNGTGLLMEELLPHMMCLQGSKDRTLGRL